MQLREAEDRRGRAQRGRSGLLERDAALQAIRLVVEEVQTGSPRALLIEGHAGMGKSRLHEAALDEARGAGIRVLRAAGAELERHMAFGVAAQLLKAQLAELPAGRRAELVASAPDRVRALLGATDVASDPAGGDLMLSHGLFAILAAADEARPALIAIDDLHWSDVASLQFVLYVLQRLEELPAAIVMTRRPDRGGAAAEVLDRIATHPRVWIETLAPLGGEAVAELARRSLGRRADATVVAACSEATAGNPFYVHELLLTLEGERALTSEQLARHARALAPDAVTRIVRVRVGRLGTQASDLARALAILGDDVPLRNAAMLAGLTIEQTSAAADALADEEILLAREPLRFVHPLVSHAINNDIPASERASRHLEAAQLLYAEAADPERVAAHLLRGRGQGNAWVVEQLRAAARDAMTRGAPPSAVRYLERALEEPPSPAERGSVLAELGSAEAAAGSPAAAGHLARAAASIDDPRQRAAIALERGRALAAQGQHAQAARAYEDGLGELGELGDELGDQTVRELHDQLQTGFIATASLVPKLQARGLARTDQLLRQASATPRTQGQRLLLAHGPLRAAYAGESAGQVVGFAQRAWSDGLLLEHAGSQWVGWRIVAAAFCLAGELERAEEIASAAIEDARHRGAPLQFATASFVRALPRLWQGRVDDALADLEPAWDARRYGWRQFVRAAAAHYALALAEHGELDRAAEVLHDDSPIGQVRDLEDVLRMYALAELRLAEGQPREALETALVAGEHAERGVEYFGYCPWRVTAAEAAVAIGQDERGLMLAQEALLRADRSGVLHQRIAARRVLGMCTSGERGLELLHEAVALGAAGPVRLEYLRALVELGAALRRSNQRAAAREPLGRVIDYARAHGALALQDRARVELAATGARPRREALLSGPASLTPSERRIAELAAAGQSNREIAQTLFVTPKTVEYHLRNAYRKLGIEGRRQLAEALGA
jgi:DNA-binding CsgD family transcriptional regulator